MADLLKLCGKLSLNSSASEIQVISKWLYKYKNMLRREKAYQKLNRVSKDFKKYYNHNIHQEIVTFAKQSDREPGSESSNLDSHTIMVKSLSLKVINCLQYIENYLTFIESTFSDLLQRIEIGHNVPLYIVVSASLSRVWVLIKLHAVYLNEASHCIQQILRFPKCNGNCSVLAKEQQSSSTVVGVTIQSAGVTGSTCHPLSVAVLSDDLIQRRQDDFKNKTNLAARENAGLAQQPTNAALEANDNQRKHRLSKREKLKKLLNTVHIVVKTRKRKSVLKIYSSGLAQRIINRIQKNSGRRVTNVLCVYEKMRASRQQHKLQRVGVKSILVYGRCRERIKRALQLKQMLLKKRQNIRNRVTRNNEDIQLTLLENKFKGGSSLFSDSHNCIESIDDIFSVIEGN